MIQDKNQKSKIDLIQLLSNRDDYRKNTKLLKEEIKKDNK